MVDEYLEKISEDDLLAFKTLKTLFEAQGLTLNAILITGDNRRLSLESKEGQQELLYIVEEAARRSQVKPELLLQPHENQ